MMSIPAATASSQNVTLPFIEELYNPNFLDVLLPTVFESHNLKASASLAAVEVPKNPMMDALKSTGNQTMTWNDSPAFSSTGSATLNAFQSLTRYASWDTIDSVLTNAWDDDPALTVRLIWNTRSIHDGKSEKELFYQAYAWLYRNHPRTAIVNLPSLVAPVCRRKGRKGKWRGGGSHGYWKDLLNILALATVDQLGSLDAPSMSTFLHPPRIGSVNPRWQRSKKRNAASTMGRAKDGAERVARAQAALSHNTQQKAQAREKRVQVAAESHHRLSAKLQDVKYRALYVAVAQLITKRLIEDIRTLQKLESLPTSAPREERLDLERQLSLVGKWAPTPGAAHDRRTNIATAVCLLLRHAGYIPVAVSCDSQTGWPALETHILRSYYARWILRPLRAALCCPEPLMAQNRWTEIQYHRVPSICMNRNTTHFCAHDMEGFKKYMLDVESGKKTISGATMMPHELVQEALTLDNDASHVPDPKKPSVRDIKKVIAEMKLRVIEGQWRTLIGGLREAGALEGALAVCDVSGSMASAYSLYRRRGVPPIFPALSLSLITAQLGKPPFNGGFITFSLTPQFVEVNPDQDGLATTLRKMSDADWDMNTDLHAVFVKLLLPLAVKNGVKQEDMIKQLFIFSDMQFDDAEGTSRDPSSWQTNHDAIASAYRDAGYEMPRIVYWNLNDHFVSVPVEAERKGVALMSGFSPSMFKTFMGEEAEEEEKATVDKDGEVKSADAAQEEFNPVNIMKKVLTRESYDGLLIVD